MSFGFPQHIKIIDDALQHAAKNNVVVLASASNSGARNGVAWPAESPQVTCIYAMDGCGNPYKRNPTPFKLGHRLMVLGEGVPGYDGRSREKVLRSGTSTATPIAAGILAILMILMRHNRRHYDDEIQSSQDDIPTRQRMMERYDRGTMSLGTVVGAERALHHLSSRRQDMDCIMPFETLRLDNLAARITLVENLFNALKVS